MTHKFSNLIDILLRPFTNGVKSHLRDTMDFLNHLHDALSNDRFLISFDVESLYSNIPHDLGLEAIKFWPEQHPEDLHIRFSKESILESIDFFLKNNTLCFLFQRRVLQTTRMNGYGDKVLPLCTLHWLSVSWNKRYIDGLPINLGTNSENIS